MKTLFTLLISLTTLAVTAQNVTVTFQGANRNRNYQVVVDGASYYSANQTNSNGRSVVTIPNLGVGAHTLAVYNATNNSTYSDGSNNNATGEELYSKTFQLRQGYDMNISVRANGAVSFTERKSKNQYSAQNGTPMSTTAFSQLLTNVRNKRYQSEKINLISNAFNTSSNYFTSSQVRQLLQLVSAESRRLDLAKLSYNRVTDPSNFSGIYDVLNSESSRDALDDYVVSKGGITSSSTQSNAAYGTAMSDANFYDLSGRIKNYTYQSDRVSEIKNAFGNASTYFSTTQVRQLLLLVTSESDRLALAKLAYAHVTDRSSFNQLVDLFYTQYNRDELNNYIVSNGGTANTVNYRAPMDESSFTSIYNKARTHFFQKNTINEVKTALNNTANNFSTEQVKQLLLLVRTEPDRLILAKSAYPRVVDAVNFSQLLDLFTIQSNRSELEIFIQAQPK
jgi:hypothetical protein